MSATLSRLRSSALAKVLLGFGAAAVLLAVFGLAAPSW